MTELEIIERASQIEWWHRIRLTPDYVTPGRLDPLEELSLSDVMERVAGKRVLDVGTWDGGMAFEAERRGALEVVAMDTWDWGFDWKPHGEWRAAIKREDPLAPRRAGFDLAREALNSKVVPMQMNIIDALPSQIGKFDIILFCGVLYHLKHPLLALEACRALCRNMMVVETHLGLPEDDRPFAAFYPGAELHGDDTNWWGPNVACVKAWLKTAGFREVEYLGGTERGILHAYV